MEKRTTDPTMGMEIDILEIAFAILGRIWLVIIAMVLCAAIGFSYAFFNIDTTYTSSALFYVNTGVSAGGVKLSVNSADISTSRTLVSTYLAILNTRMTLEAVSEAADMDYSYEQLRGMIASGAVGDTEVFSVSVTTDDPIKSQTLANTIAEVLPLKVAEIIDGASMRVVDYAVADWNGNSRGISKYTMMGAIVGALLVCGIIALRVIMDDSIHDEGFLMENFNIPILGVIPDMCVSEEGKKYYNKYGKYYYGKNKYSAQYRSKYK